MMGAMNPFDQPPAGAPVAVTAPEPMPDRPRRGRTALVALATLGLVGAGVAGVSQLASADRPELEPAAQGEPTDDTIAPPDETSDEPLDVPDETAESDGQIVIDAGDGDPVVIDLGDLDAGRIEALSECIGLPAFDLDGSFGEFTPGDWSAEEFPFDLGDLDEFFEDMPIDLDALDELAEEWKVDSADGTGRRVFDLDGTVTVAGPDGVSVIDLGDNGSVTVSNDDGEVTISTSGDATVSDLDDLFGEFDTIFEDLPDLFDDEAIADIVESLPPMEDWAELETIDPDAVRSCIDEVLGD
jgi:hypothetical protein